MAKSRPAVQVGQCGGQLLGSHILRKERVQLPARVHEVEKRRVADEIGTRLLILARLIIDPVRFGGCCDLFVASG
jgi:hypothetical protein